MKYANVIVTDAFIITHLLLSGRASNISKPKTLTVSAFSPNTFITALFTTQVVELIMDSAALFPSLFPPLVSELNFSLKMIH